MANAEIINTVTVWLFPFLMIIISILYKKDQKQQQADRKEFKDFMHSQSELNEKNSEILIRLVTLEEVASKSR